MRSCLLVLLLGLGSLSSCAKEPAPLGGACQRLHECQQGLICLDQACAPARLEGERCDDTNFIVCDAGLECGEEGLCITVLQVEERRKERDEAAKRAMLVQSGLDQEQIDAAARVAEQEEPAQAGGLPVRVSRTDATGSGFAACRDDERLIGGACESKGMLSSSVPSGFGATDTVGARWSCTTTAPEIPLVSYALCQKLPMAKPERPRQPEGEASALGRP